MKYCRIPPGDAPMADAFNLMVCAYHAQQSPQLAQETERMAKTIARNVEDWEDVAANLALLAAQLATAAGPEISEQIRLAIEADNLIPA